MTVPELLPTTVVGSYPVHPSHAECMAAYRTGRDPYRQSLERAVEAQVTAGLDIISDGQTRAGIVSLFASRLGGIRMKGRPVIFGDVSFRRSITTDDLVHARDVAAGRAAVKGIVTGPYTLARGCVNAYYDREEDAAFTLARALNAEVRALEAAGAPAVQVDEPFFSVDLPPYAQELLVEVVRGLEVPVTLHVCGKVAPVLDTLAVMPVAILDLEFAADPQLLDAVADTGPTQRIGLGCVRSDDDRVETVDEVAALIRRACELLGPERVVPDPDCGLKKLPREAADAKLRNLVAAARQVRDELG
ncbi:MAG: methionine synthase [Methanopyri archaeon]|nr:methionine synthase [Methanopyri archaeon]